MRAVSRTVASQVQWKPDHSVARIRSYVPGASNLSYIGRHLPTAHLGHHVLSVGEVDALTWGIIAVVNPPDDLRDVLANELRLLDPAVRRSRDAMLRLLHEDFRKVGASVAHGTATPSSRPWPRRSGMVLSPQRIRAPSRTGPIGARWDTGLVTACCIRLRRWSPDDTRHDRHPVASVAATGTPTGRRPRRLLRRAGRAARRGRACLSCTPVVHGRAVAENSPMA